MANINELRAIDARSYQVEMLHESLKKNIVVAVSSGLWHPAVSWTLMSTDGHRQWKDSYV